MDLAKLYKRGSQAVLLSLLTATWAQCQGHPPRLDELINNLPDLSGYITLSLEQNQIPGWQVMMRNNYSSPLVAVSYAYRCSEVSPRGHEGEVDAAMGNVDPLVAPGKSTVLTHIAENCSGGPVTLIFADGTKAGEPEEIQRLLDNRIAARQELMEILKKDVLPYSSINWDPALMIATIKAKLAELPSMSFDFKTSQRLIAQRTLLTTLLADTESFQKYSPETEEQAEADRKSTYMNWLCAWPEALSATQYPATKSRRW